MSLTHYIFLQIVTNAGRLWTHKLTNQSNWLWLHVYRPVPGIIVCMRPASKRRRYNVSSSLIGWAQKQNDPRYPNRIYTIGKKY